MTRYAILLLVCAGLCASGVSAKEMAPPNVVMIISDDQAWTDYGFMGHRQVQTPNLDRLASESIVFRRGYVPTALCRPSLLTMLTGLYPHQHGVTGNDPSPRYSQPGSETYRQRRQELISRVASLETIPRILAAQGYRCFQSGKWWEGGYRNGGFTAGMTRGFPEPGGRHGDDGLKIGRQGMTPLDQFVTSAVNDSRPFFVWYAPMLPHTPHNPPSRLAAKYADPNRSAMLSRYFAMCEWYDETVGELMGVLKRTGQLDNTLVISIADNGWIQSEDSPRYALRSKQSPFEGGVRTPILFHWPGRLKPSVRPEVISSIDLLPTILGACQLKAKPAGLPGLNLWDHLQTAKPIPRKVIFGEAFAHDIADLEDHEASLLFRWCIEDQWKLILTYDGETNRHTKTHPRLEKRPQLFNLRADPHEKKNLAADNPEIVKRMADRIEQWYPLQHRKTLTKFAPLPRPPVK